MKKSAVLLVALFVMALAYSCKPKEKCPAYGKANYETMKKSRS